MFPIPKAYVQTMLSLKVHRLPSRKEFPEMQSGKNKYQKVAEVYNTTINESTLRMELKKYLDENKFITAKNFCRFCLCFLSNCQRF